MLRTLLVTAPLVALASAFSDTYPVVAWASHKSSLLDKAPAHSDVYAHLLSAPEICEYDAVVLVSQPGLHATDLRTLSPTHPLPSTLASAPASLQIPYARRPSTNTNAHDLAEALAQRCGARFASGTEDFGFALDGGAKHVVSVHLPEVEGDVAGRKAAVAASAHTLTQSLTTLTSAARSHLIIFTGSPCSSKHNRRQLSVSSISDSPLLADADDDSFLTPTVTPLLDQRPPVAFAAPSGGILARYQLLTPGLITALLIAFFVLLPAVLFAVSALSSIQSPLRVEAPKGYSAEGKKNQ